MPDGRVIGDRDPGRHDLLRRDAQRLDPCCLDVCRLIPVQGSVASFEVLVECSAQRRGARIVHGNLENLVGHPSILAVPRHPNDRHLTAHVVHICLSSRQTFNEYFKHIVIHIV